MVFKIVYPGALKYKVVSGFTVKRNFNKGFDFHKTQGKR